MAAIAHSDTYTIFMRKIGYSVGLEHTLDRLNDLHDLYSSSKDVTFSSWRELVYGIDKWKLKSDNIVDFFYSLRLVQRISGDLLILENLDALTIACSMLESEQEKQRAREFILLWAIMSNDGEIFVNLMQAGFEEKKLKEILTSMINKKRTILKEVLPGRDSHKRINRTVNIERQVKNKGSTGMGKSVTSLYRTEPLQATSTRSLSEQYNNSDVEFSEDYIRKVPPRRREWARSLGLWDNKFGMTKKGSNFLKELKNLGYIDDGVFIFWPLDYELIRAGFKRDLLKNTKCLWQSLVDFGSAYADLRVSSPAENDPDDTVLLIGEMMRIFQNHHVRKLLLRRELPTTIAYPAIVAFALARGKPVIDLPSALEAEQIGDKRRLAFRTSRNTGGAISIMR